MLNLIHHTQLKSLTDAFLNKPVPTKIPKKPIAWGLASYIDQTLLKPDSPLSQIEKLCEESKENNFKALCVQPFYLPTAVRFLAESSTLPITVVGFPLGSGFSDTKVFETKKAVQEGAKEIDMVISLPALKSQKYDFVFEDIRKVVDAADEIPVKVIIETAYLTREEKIFCCACVAVSRAAFIKTSTGFAEQGAQIEDVQLFKHLLGNTASVKASGGIKTKEQMTAFLEAGADRIGTSSGVEILKNLASTKDY